MMSRQVLMVDTARPYSKYNTNVIGAESTFRDELFALCWPRNAFST
jgi:hypothetical protein